MLIPINASDSGEGSQHLGHFSVQIMVITWTVSNDETMMLMWWENEDTPSTLEDDEDLNLEELKFTI